MALETGTYISDLVATNPTSTDPKDEGDDHLRLLKSTIKTTFPNVDGAVSATDEQLSFVTGVTSAIQTQIDTKSPIASPTFTGTPAAPTAAPGTNTTQVATTAFVIAEGFIAALPSQAGNAGKLINTDGATASWSTTINATVMDWADGADPNKLMAFDLSGITTGNTRTVTIPDADFTPVGTTLTQTLTNKTITIDDDNFTLQDNLTTSKKAVFQLSGITASTTRTITLADNDITLDTPARKWLATYTISNDPNLDIETELDGTYDEYILQCSGVTCATDAQSLRIRLKYSGAYSSTGTDYSYHVSNLDGATAGYNAIASATNGYIELVSSLGNAAGERADFNIHIKDLTSSAFKLGTVQGAAVNNLGELEGFDGSFQLKNTNTLQGVRFLMSSGNLSTGSIRVYGIRSA